jgi:hypothetical protein
MNRFAKVVASFLFTIHESRRVELWFAIASNSLILRETAQMFLVFIITRANRIHLVFDDCCIQHVSAYLRIVQNF